MPAIDLGTWLRQPAAQAVGWALLQFVWQGAAVGALTAAALIALRRSASDVRYVVSSIGLALMLTLPLVTGVQKYQSVNGRTAATGTGVIQPAASLMNADRVAAVAANTQGGPTATSTPTSAAARWLPRMSAPPADALLPPLILVWLAGVSLLSLRLLTGWLWVQRLRTRGIAPAEQSLARMAARLSRRLHISRAVTLLQSSLVEVPTVIGFLSPVVLLPAAALGGLSTQQIEAILAHELAHIRRHDYLVNLLQTLVETVLFYHPAVWWLSRRIRIERENCCDDLAVSLCGDPVAYATALADLEALRSSGPAPVHHIAMAATGGSLLHRIRRLLGAPSSHSGRGPAWLAGSVALLLIGGIALGADTSPQDPVVTPAIAARAATAARPVAPQRAAAATARPAAAMAVEPMLAQAAAEESRRATVAAAAEPAIAAAAAAEPAIAAAIAAAEPSAAAAPVQASISHHVDNSTGNWIWSNNGDKLQVNYSGTFEFTDDDTDVRQISPGGSLKISDGNWLGRHSVEIRERDGRIEHLYYVNGVSHPYEPDGRAWLQEKLPRFVRNTGIGAEARVARILKSGGPSGVMAEIGRIDSTYVKGIYFKQLFSQASLNGEQYRQVMAQAGREMRGSAYELAQLLIAVADKLPNDEASRAGYFEAASGIRSDYELRRVYSTMLKRGPVSPAILGGILAAAKSISSDYDLSELLRQILAQQPLDERNRAAFFAAVATLNSGYERHRVLSAVVGGSRATDPVVLEAALTAASTVTGDYETSQFLQEVLRQNGVEGSVRAPFFAAVAHISGAYERGRVLQAVVRKPGVSNETLRAVLQASRAMSGYDLSQLLQIVANSHVITGDLRDAYLDAADRLSGYEQGQVMTALVKSERRK